MHSHTIFKGTDIHGWVACTALKGGAHTTILPLTNQKLPRRVDALHRVIDALSEETSPIVHVLNEAMHGGACAHDKECHPWPNIG